MGTGRGRGRPTESGLGLQKGLTRFKTENGLSARSEIEEGAGSLPAEGGIAGEDAGRWFCGGSHACDMNLILPIN
jgi:hypothetical protein